MANQQTRQLQKLAHKNGIHNETYFVRVVGYKVKVPLVEIQAHSHGAGAFSEERAAKTRERRLRQNSASWKQQSAA